MTPELMYLSEASQLKLEAPTNSRLHQLIDAIHDDRARLNPKQGELGALINQMTVWLLAHPTPPILVQHDWAAAFRGAEEFDAGEWRLPYPRSVFEFRCRVDGEAHALIVLVGGGTEGETSGVAVEEWGAALMCIETAGVWAMTAQPAGFHGRLTDITWSQIRAACIALDADVVKREAVHASVALNKARTKRGRAPLSDYHILRLAHRYVTRGEPLGGTHATPRLHFRRGHWRHLPSAKTWVRWCLVGDPDLGFVNKEYRL